MKFITPIFLRLSLMKVLGIHTLERRQSVASGALRRRTPSSASICPRLRPRLRPRLATMEQALIDRVCQWTKHAYTADRFLDEMVEDIRSSFETRMEFRAYKPFLLDKIYDYGLPEEVKREYDHTTDLLQAGNLTPELKKKRSAIQLRVSRLLGKLEMAVFGAAIDKESMKKTPSPKTKTRSVKKEEKEEKEDVESCVTEPLFTDVVKELPETIIIRRPRSSVSYEEKDDGDDDDDDDGDDDDDDGDDDVDDDEINQDQVFNLPLNHHTKILVIGDQERYDYFLSNGFTNVLYRSSINMEDLEDAEVILIKKD